MDKFSLVDLNDLYYCVGKVFGLEGLKMIEDKRCMELLDKLNSLIIEEEKVGSVE